MKGKELRITEFLLDQPNVNPLHIDFTILGLIKKTWSFDKGLRTTRSYIHPDFKTDNGEDVDVVLLRREFEFADNGDITKMYKVVDYIDIYGDVGESKREEIFKNKGQLKAFNREVRQSQIDFLEESGVGTPVEPYILALVKHYKNFPEEVNDVNGDKITVFKNYMQEYVEDRLPNFENAVENEVEQPYLTYLQIVVEAPSTEYPTGKTVKDSILYQIK